MLCDGKGTVADPNCETGYRTCLGCERCRPSAAAPVDPKLEACARAAHETNRAFCEAIGDPVPPPWDQAPYDMRDSTLSGVRGVLNGNDERASHKAWAEFKLSQGWTYGPDKDWANKKHPNLVPYDELSREQRNKDGLFVGAVRMMAAALGMKVVYPAVAAHDDRPALPKREIDWSTWKMRDLSEE